MGDDLLFRLVGLLSDMFVSEELRRFVHLNVDADLAPCLPSEVVGPAELSYRAALALQMRGHVGSSRLFDLLVEVRPLWAEEIRNLEEAYRLRRGQRRRNDETSARNALKTAELIDRTVGKIEQGDRQPRAWTSLQMLITSLLSLLAGKFLFTEQDEPGVPTEPEAQEALLARAKEAFIYARAYGDVVLTVLSLPPWEKPGSTP